ncbi:helix-turn-helix domain-containing protein [Phytopseudomonas flavescens]|uniref:helix-turn-helix domain-containing protein n=1 Tax=Phytopseudomonas flavescens TaxID=29435 RepID=UPI000A0780BF|nr:helix-turn-helix domain-containing protein [Pseudomonas flavescens]
MEIFDVPLDLDRRWEWIKFQLRVRHTSTAEIARQMELNERAIRSAKHRSYPRVEREIAAVLGVLPAQLWPERWNADGTPVRQRPNRPEANATSTKKDTGYCPVENSKSGRSDRNA